MTQIRVNYQILQPVTAGYSSIRIALPPLQPLVDAYSKSRIDNIHGQPLVDGYSTARVSGVVCQALFPVLPEPPMSTEKFPGFGNSTTNPAVPAILDPFSTALPGLSYGIHKKPGFATNIKRSSSGREVRTAKQSMPIWEFEFSYEFLDDSTGAQSSLKTIMGFYLSRLGSFDTFLLKDPDDYLVENGVLGESDGVTTSYYFSRGMGSFYEIVGQVDDSNTITLYHSIEEGGTIPGTGTPRTITVANSASFVEDLGVTLGGNPMTRVDGTPSPTQYSVVDGVYTFNPLDGLGTVVISYRYEIDAADYTVTLPNMVVFDTAPTTGTISADFQFFFACRFAEDNMDFEKFMDKLWNLQSCNLVSVLQ